MNLFACILFVAATGAFDGASWIASSDPEGTPKFVRSFTVGANLKSASLAVTGVGFCEAALNGARLGERLLDPSQTDYDRRVYYAVYPVAPKAGANELALTVGHGWYDQRSSGWDFQKAPWRGKPRAIAALTLTYADGRVERVVTDGAWREVASGIRYDDIREGEWQDGTMSAFMRPVEIVSGPKGALQAADFPGAAKTAALQPKEITRLADGGWLVDFGLNVSGWARFAPADAAALKGKQLHFRYDERKPPQPRHIHVHVARFGQKDFPHDGEAFQTDHRLFAGTPGEAYEPHFVYHGFRYLTVYGLDRAPTAGELTAWQVNTAFGEVGSFESSDPNLDALVRMAAQSYRANFTDGVPTDCPHREKNGWTGDASLASEFAQYAFENTAAYRKWLRDLCDATHPDGALPGIVPTGGWGYDLGSAWGVSTYWPGSVWDSALPVIAWNLCRYRGATDVASLVLPALRRNLDFAWAHRTADGLGTGNLAEWCAVGERPDSRFVNSCYLIGNLELGAKLAEVAGDRDFAALCRARALETRAATRRAFHFGNGLFDDGAQTAQALAIAFGLCETDAERAGAARQLRKEIAEADTHFNIGILGMDKLGVALPAIGENRLMYEMLVNPTEPSPRASWLDRGFTTLAEDFYRGASWDHVMFASFGAWAYQSLAGIRLGAEKDGADYEIRPCPVRALAHVTAQTDFGRGPVRSAWKHDGTTFTLTATVPDGTTARIVLPDGTAANLAAGTKTFACALPPERPRETFELSHRHDPMFWIAGAGSEGIPPTLRLPRGGTAAAEKNRKDWNGLLRRTMITDADPETYRAFYRAVYNLYGRVRNVADAQGLFIGADGAEHVAARRRHMRIDLPESSAYGVYAFWTLTARPCESDDFLWSPLEAAMCGDRLRYLPGVADGHFKEHRSCDYPKAWPTVVARLTGAEKPDATWLAAALALGEAITNDAPSIAKLRACTAGPRPVAAANDDVARDIATIWDTLGLRPGAPCSDRFTVALPRLRSARISVFEKNGSENILRITVAPDAARAKGAWRATFNGRPLANNEVRRSDLFKGGELLFTTQGEKP